jgi:hypothetical protein
MFWRCVSEGSTNRNRFSQAAQKDRQKTNQRFRVPDEAPIAETTNAPVAQSASPYSATDSGRHRRDAVALLIAAAAWFLPGLGHALLKMWGRAFVCFSTVALLVIIGAGMRGNIFSRNGEDAFAKLGYLADLGAGSFYFGAQALEAKGPDVSHANGDYGTRLLATAGVLNMLAALHAYEVMRARKA